MIKSLYQGTVRNRAADFIFLLELENHHKKQKETKFLQLLSNFSS